MPYMDHMGYLCSEIGRDNAACLPMTSRNFRAFFFAPDKDK